MTPPRILCLSGSARSGSHNSHLAALAKKELTLGNIAVTQISLADYSLPIFNQDEETATGVPTNAEKLYDLFCAHHGIFIACPEYNASVTPLLKNTIDWISRVKRSDMPFYAAYRNRVFALGAASPGVFGGYRGLLTVRHIVEIGLGGHVLAEQFSVPRCTTAFKETGEFVDEALARKFGTMLERLVELAQYYARKG